MEYTKVLVFGLLFSISANAQLADRFRYRQDVEAENHRQKGIQRIVDAAYDIVRHYGKSKIVSGPEVEKRGESSVTWYFRLENNKVCSVALSTAPDGTVNFAWANTAQCVQD